MSKKNRYYIIANCYTICSIFGLFRLSAPTSLILVSASHSTYKCSKGRLSCCKICACNIVRLFLEFIQNDIHDSGSSIVIIMSTGISMIRRFGSCHSPESFNRLRYVASRIIHYCNVVLGASPSSIFNTIRFECISQNLIRIFSRKSYKTGTDAHYNYKHSHKYAQYSFRSLHFNTSFHF